MSQRGGFSGLKRKHPGSEGSSKELTPDERNIYNLIKSKGDMGIWKGDIRKGLPITNAKIVDNCVKSLLVKQMIKEVPNIQAKGKKQLMAMEFVPSKVLTGGAWYQEGILDSELVDSLKKFCLNQLTKQKVATADGIYHEMKLKGRANPEISQITFEQVKEILTNMVLGKEISMVKSNGMGEFESFPVNADCYKPKPKRAEAGAFSMIPCGVCPRIRHCAPDGIISPVTCVYYNKWLEF